MPTYPSFAEGIGSKSAVGIAKEATFRTYVTPTAYSPFLGLTLAEEPGVYSPATMQGLITTDVYVQQGEAKGNGALTGPLYATNGVPALIGSIGLDNTAGNGVTTYNAPIGVAGTVPTAGTSTSLASTGVTSLALTGIAGTFAANQVVLISGSSDAAGGWEYVQATAFSTPNLTITATAKTHSGTITVTTVGAVSSGSVSAGGSTITLATGLGALFAASGDIVQIDVNSGTTTSSEIHKVTVSTDTLTIADTSPNNTLFFAHASGVSVVRLAKTGTTGLYEHVIPSGTLGSYSIEQNIAGVESLKWAGCKFSKGGITCPTGNAPATMNLDIMAAADPVVLASPTSASTNVESPFQFAEGSLNIFGAAHTEIYNVKCDWDNVMKATYTQASSHWPSFLTKTNFHVIGSFDAVFHNFDDSNDGFWTKMDAVTTGALTYTLAHADGSSIIVSLPKVAITKLPITYKPADVVFQSLSFMAFYDLTNAVANMTLKVINSVYTPY